MKREEKRYAELKERDEQIMKRVSDCSLNIAALHRLVQKEDNEIIILLKERASFEKELLELQANRDYENDTKAEQSLNQ